MVKDPMYVGRVVSKITLEDIVDEDGLLVGASGNRLVTESVATATPGAGNGETLPSSTNVVFYDPNGASRTGVILAPGTRDGQECKVVNIANAAESVTFAAAGTSNVAAGTACVIAQNFSAVLTWNVATSLWYHNVIA